MRSHTQPGLPMKKGRCATMTHDYKRHGTTTLFAALNILEDKVIGRCMQRHRHQEFIRFLNAVEREVSADKAIHVVLDNYATQVRACMPGKDRGQSNKSHLRRGQTGIQLVLDEKPNAR